MSTAASGLIYYIVYNFLPQFESQYAIALGLFASRRASAYLAGSHSRNRHNRAACQSQQPVNRVLGFEQRSTWNTQKNEWNAQKNKWNTHKSTEKHVEHAEKHVEHAEKHRKTRGTRGKARGTRRKARGTRMDWKTAPQEEQKHNVNSAGTTLLMAERTNDGARHCCFGQCRSDERCSEKYKGIAFFPFPKPKGRVEVCLLVGWLLNVPAPG